MTRENKLALIIGFGLLLFVGILVSDHLSARTGPAVVPIALRTKEQVSLPRELEVPREFGQANQPLPPTNPEFEDTRIVRVHHNSSTFKNRKSASTSSQRASRSA